MILSTKRTITSPQTIVHKRGPRHLLLGIQVLAYAKHRDVTGYLCVGLSGIFQQRQYTVICQITHPRVSES